MSYFFCYPMVTFRLNVRHVDEMPWQILRHVSFTSQDFKCPPFSFLSHEEKGWPVVNVIKIFSVGNVNFRIPPKISCQITRAKTCHRSWSFLIKTSRSMSQKMAIHFMPATFWVLHNLPKFWGKFQHLDCCWKKSFITLTTGMVAFKCETALNAQS